MNHSDLQRCRGDLRHRGDRRIGGDTTRRRKEKSTRGPTLAKKRQPAVGWANPRCGRGLVVGWNFATRNRARGNPARQTRGFCQPTIYPSPDGEILMGIWDKRTGKPDVE